MTLFAARGFKAVSIGDIGSGAGVSGPAVYRHFASKEAILSELLINISQYLYDGGERITGGVLSGDGDTDNAAASQPSDGDSASRSGSRDPSRVLRELIDFHLDFTASDPELIRIQDRDWSALPESSRREVRRLQRAYVSHWVKVLRAVHPALAEDAATVRAHAVFGMLNSTPYVLRRRPQQVVENELRRGALALVAVR